MIPKRLIAMTPIPFPQCRIESKDGRVQSSFRHATLVAQMSCIPLAIAILTPISRHACVTHVIEQLIAFSTDHGTDATFSALRVAGSDDRSSTTVVVTATLCASLTILTRNVPPRTGLTYGCKGGGGGGGGILAHDCCTGTAGRRRIGGAGTPLQWRQGAVLGGVSSRFGVTQGWEGNALECTCNGLVDGRTELHSSLLLLVSVRRRNGLLKEEVLTTDHSRSDGEDAQASQ